MAPAGADSHRNHWLRLWMAQNHGIEGGGFTTLDKFDAIELNKLKINGRSCQILSSLSTVQMAKHGLSFA